MIRVDVILSPAILPYYDAKGKTVVIIDILRATTSICVAFKTGVKKILPVSSVEEAMYFKDFDFIVAAERNAVKVDSADMGNSPFEFESPLLKEKNIVLTTTNGTKAINICKELGAEKILIGSFLNINSLCSLLHQQTNDILLVCSGWKHKINTEDTLFAGAVVDNLGSNMNIESDACQIAQTLYLQYKNNLDELVYKSNHAQRFKLMHGNTDDIAYCLQLNTVNLVPYLHNEFIIV